MQAEHVIVWALNFKEKSSALICLNQYMTVQKVYSDNPFSVSFSIQEQKAFFLIGKTFTSQT